MKREFRITADGSHTLYVPFLDESYHSVHGAIRESNHVFIREGFYEALKLSLRPSLKILETGLGTGLNVLLTLKESRRTGTDVYYHAVEKFPLEEAEYTRLNYELLIDELPVGFLHKIHEAPWEEDFRLGDNFTLRKERTDFRTMRPGGAYDLVYFDAFAPGKQPQLWTKEVFSKIFDLLNPGGILVTYSSRSSIRKELISCGFNVEKIPGPPGKREMTRASKR